MMSMHHFPSNTVGTATREEGKRKTERNARRGPTELATGDK